MKTKTYRYLVIDDNPDLKKVRIYVDGIAVDMVMVTETPETPEPPTPPAAAMALTPSGVGCFFTFYTFL